MSLALYCITSNNMSPNKTYQSYKEILFKKILQISLFGSFVLLVLILATSGAIRELVMGGVFISFVLFNWIVFKYVSKNLAYHLMIWSLFLVLGYPIFIQGHSYYAVVIYPMVALVFNVVFFDDKRTHWMYFIFFVIVEFFLLASTMGEPLFFPAGNFYPEFLNAIVYMFCFFFISQFFILNLRKQQEQLTISKAAIETKRLELVEKNKVLDKYIESNIQLESFAHLAAHELKAPLRSITGFAGLLRKKIQGKLTEEEDNMFEVISESNRKMHDMVGSLNQLGSVSKMELNPTEFSIDELIDEISFERKNDFIKKNAVVNSNFSIPIINGDRTLIKQLLSNLIGNALKFVSIGVTPLIEISLDQIDDELLFIVRDNGIGIPEDKRENIFTLFERLNNRSEFSGSGIGLAICKKIVDLHNGKIWVETSPTGGSEFHIILPIQIASKQTYKVEQSKLVKVNS